MLIFENISFIARGIVFLVCAGVVAAVVLGCLQTAKSISFEKNNYEDNPVVKKYKLYGISCTGTSPHIVRREGAGTGIELTYDIDGRRIKGVLDDYFVMDDLMAKAITESGEPLEICVHPDNEKVFCLMDELYRQKKEYNHEKAFRRNLTFGWKLRNTVELVSVIVFFLIILFIKFSF